MDQLWAWLSVVPWWGWLLIFPAIIAIKDIFFIPAHTIKHNFPNIGHLYYWLESTGPEMRQYFTANNREELPFNRIERGCIFASVKKENNYEKAPVEFTSIYDLEACQYLGGKGHVKV